MRLFLAIEPCIRVRATFFWSEIRSSYSRGMATFWFGFQNPSRVTAADTSAGIVIAMEYQKFHLGTVN